VNFHCDVQLGSEHITKRTLRCCYGYRWTVRWRRGMVEQALSLYIPSVRCAECELVEKGIQLR